MDSRLPQSKLKDVLFLEVSVSIKSQPDFPLQQRLDFWVDTVDGCEILHQLIDGKHPIHYF